MAPAESVCIHSCGKSSDSCFEFTQDNKNCSIIKTQAHSFSDKILKAHLQTVLSVERKALQSQQLFWFACQVQNWFLRNHWKSCGRAEIVIIYGTVIQLRDRSSVWVDKHLSATWHSLWEVVCQFISIQRIWCIELTKSLSVKKVNVEFSCALFSTKTFTAFVSTCPPYKNTPMFVAQNPDCKHILLSSCDIQRPIQLLWRKKPGTSESAAAKLGACKQSSHRGENGSQSLCSGVMPSTNKARRREKTVARQRISRDFSSGLPITFKQSDAVNPF